ncbi:hemagglutinin repeat-containing protein [Pantoea agglomerans]|uniref:Hemagglutinin repeat-containing protein n=2 Tax=Erwiniaceae TaxID=1903409 RepID=A0ACC5RH44_ENTAG|nr:hemagglutinin repeat-containing protein [Pantoea agglomerans]MBK4723851.1 hemagglutinin repeat-containing protein [Pantoea agglomerans]
MDNHQQPVRRSQRLLSYLICTLIAGQPLLPAVAAAITPVTPGSQMDKAANGVPVLNIATPNQAGISHNQFSDYNVGKPGLILNNATDRLTQTQLGGLIQNNPNLKAGKEARGIINEVVGGNRSQLQGFTEVAGKAANVMVVNPYGITCNGCGFINTPQVTLTTGKPTFDSQGNVSSLAVSKGTIIVEGQGLNASQSDALSIIARATEINADIHARDLTVIAGSNRVDAQGKVTAQGSQDPQPSVAVDTGALGGMYANRIRLVSSDKGVGVNLGNLNARQGDITLDASGKLTMNNSLASGALSVRAGTVALSGDHKAGGDITVSSDGDVALKNAALVSDRDVIINAGKTGALESGKLTAGRDIQLSGDALTLDSASQANAAGDIRATATTLLSQQGQMTAGQDLTLNADALDNRGALNASRNLNARATTQRNSGTMQSSGDLTVSGSQLKNQGKMLSGGSLTLTGDRLEQNGTLSAKTQASLTLSDRLTQGAQGEILSDGLLSMRAGQLEQQGLLSGDRGVHFSGDGLNQQQGARITSQQAIDLQADQMQLGGEVNADGDLTLNAGTLTTQSTAQVQSGGNLKLAAQQATLNGTHAARGDLIVNATTLNHNGKSNAARIALTADSLNNHGTLVAPELSLSTQHLTNGGLLDGSRSLQLQTNLFDNLQGATLHSAGDLALSPARLNNAGLIASDGDLTLSGDSLFNRGEINAHNLSADYLDLHNQQGGLLLAQGQLTTVSQSLDNAGQMAAATLHVSGDRIENSGTLQGNDSLALKAHTITSQGDMVSDGALSIDGDSLNNGGALQGAVLALTLVQQFANQQGAEVNATRSLAIDAATVVNDGQMVTPALTLNSASLVNRGWMQGDNTLVVNSATIDNLAGGTLVSGDRAELTSTTLNNGGQLQAGHLVLSSNNLNNSGTLLMNHQGELTVAQTLTNSGLLQANRALTLGTRQLVNTASGALIDSGGLTLTLDSLRNDGLLQISDALDVTARELNNQGKLLAGRTLALNATSLINGGLMQGDERLTLDSTSLDNSGQIRSLADGKVSADSLLNTGKITAQDLALSGNVLRNSGLWQGNQHLGVTAGQLTQSASGQALSGGMLELSSHTLTTDGTLQGAQVSVTAQSWQHLGTAIGSAGISAQVGDTLVNTGEILSQGGIQLDAATLNNTGKLLGEDVVTLRATGFTNQGAVQGSTLAVDAATLTNNGTLVGLQALTLGSLPAAVARMALAATPAVQRIYSGSGKLLTQGTLRINGDSLSNDGIWQAQDIVANARTLSNQGRIQSADSLELQLSDTLTSAANSQIGAQGEALLHAATLSNQGQWTAKNLALTADALDNQGTISGVDNLTLGLTGALKQQQAGSLLSGGALGVNATSIENAGRIQGNTLAMNGSTLENSGRLQGDNGLTLVLGDRLTNHQNGILFSQQALTLQAAQMTNDGVIQGGKQTRLDITGTAQNNGKLLFSDDLTFNASQLNNGGWLQATDLLLKAAQVENTGTLLAQQQGAFTGNSLINQGSVQGDRLTVNYQQLNNSGTVLGNQQLDVTAANVEQQGGGKLLSGGNLTLKANQLSPTGQLVALGDVTATLANAFTHRGTLAAGNQLTVTSNGAIDNQGVMQGQGVNLSAGAVLTNNGKITTGTRTSTLSGSQINLNDAGSVQGGGDISLTSRGDINIAGFTGTSGSLTLTAPGSIINTALLYAGQDMRLQANSIRNQRGDILADNNLWMQRDAAGNANSEIINTSGTIETRNGDITMATAHLLNQRDGLTVVRQITNIIDASAGYVDVPLSSFNPQDILYENMSGCGGGRNDSCHNSYTASLKNKEDKTRKQLVSTESITATANGGASRIAAAGDLIVRAGDLENNASSLLAGNRIKLTGNQLNNDSVENGIISRYQTYVNKTDIAGGGTPITSGNFRFEISGGPEFTTKSGTAYTAVIQAGGALTASFTSNISNTTTRANTGTITSTLAKPVLNTLSQQGIGSTVQQQALSGTEKVTVNSPQWQSQIQSALQQMSGGKALDSNGQPLATLADQRTNNNNGTSLFTKNPASLQQPVAQGVDTSAWPLPTGNNGYFVPASDPKSPYLIVTNPQLDGLGKLDHNLFGDLNALLGKQPGSAPQETRSAYTDQKQFLGSSYLLDRLNLKPDYDYRLLGDAAFDTRYVSNALLNQTGNRYLNGVGSDLEQMRYLLDNAASAQQSLGLKFGVSLDAKQVAALEHSIVWWEATQINGETVMVPKLYLSPKDVTVNSGSVIAANSVELNAGTLNNNGSTLAAKTDLNINSQNSISNLNAGLISAAGDMNLSALGDINNIGSAISGKTLTLESLDGSINNQTLATQWNASSNGWFGSSVAMSQTQLGTTATMSAQQGVTLKAGKDITVTGSKVTAGGDLKLDAAGDIAINANQTSSSSRYTGYAGKNIASSGKVDNVGSDLSAGGSLTLNAGNDLSATASTISATKDLSLSAGHDLNLNAADTAQRSSKGKGENHVTGQDRTTLTSGNDLTLRAGRDLNSQAAGLVADNDVTLQAGRDVNLLAATTTKGDSYRSSERTEIHEAVRQQGTEIASGGNTAVQAGRDINSDATQVTAQQDIALNAGNDVNLTTATESDYFYKEETKTKKGFLSKKTTHTIKEDYSTSEKGTLLSGDNVSVEAGKNILVKGSQVVGDDDVTLKAASNIDIVAATNTDSSWRFSETKKSGLMGTGGIGITIGTSSQKHDLKVKGTTQSQSVSTVGSTGGNVTVSAADGVKISGADLVAGQSLTVNGDSVVIAPGHDKRTADERFEQKSTGITLALSGAVGEAINNAIATAQAAKGESDSRLAALQATKTALSGVQAKLASQQAQVSGDPNSGIGISISLTTQKSKSQSQQVSDAVSGSTLNAGQNLAITATGKGQSANSGDIAIGGSQLKAGGDTTLTAANDILLTGAANTQQSTGSNSSGGGGVGISFGVGNGSAGLSIFASVNGAKGKDTGNGTQWSETTLDSGGNVSLNSGRDTTLTGAQVNGNKVSADVGRNLTITSQQDSDRYDSKQTSFGAGGSFTFGSMTASGYINASQDKMHSTYDSVMEQSGIYAGKGGFDIQVGDHTQLNGAVIASQAGADNNRLETGTLGFSDLGNEADYKVSHSGISAGMSNGGSMGGQMLGNVLSNSASTLLAGLNGKGHAEGTTQSAVEQGTIVIRDTANQQQDVGSLSRDTASANGSISPIFDKEKEQKRLQTAQAVGEITGQMVSIVNTMGDIKGLEEAKKGAAPLKDNATEKERAKWLAGLRESDAYQKAMSDYGVGSKNQMVVQAVSGVLQGLVNGNISQAVAGAANPLVAQVIKAQTTDAGGNTNVVANAMAHAVWGAVAAQMSGGNAAAGAAGAFSGELATRFIAEAFYHASTPEEIARLSQADKEQLSLLGTIAAGAAGAVAGNSSAAATTGALAGKNAVENNSLSVMQARSLIEEQAKCQTDTECRQSVTEKYAKLNKEQHLSVEQCDSAKECVAKANEMGKLQTEYANRLSELVDKSRAGGLDEKESQEWIYLNSVLPTLEMDRGTAIKRALASGESAEAKQLAINSIAQAGAAGAAGIVGGTGKVRNKPESSTNQVITKNIDPNILISRQNKNEMSGSQVKRLVKDMKTNGFDVNEPIDAAIVNGKVIIIDGHHRAEAAAKAGIKDVPVRIHDVTTEQGDQLLREAAEARVRY